MFYRGFILYKVKAHLRLFSNFFSNMFSCWQINGLCLTLLLCKCKMWIITKAFSCVIKQIIIFRVISSLTMQMFTKRFYSRFILCWVKALDGFQSFFQTRSAINCTTDIVWPCCYVWERDWGEWNKQLQTMLTNKHTWMHQ